MTAGAPDIPWKAIEAGSRLVEPLLREVIGYIAGGRKTARLRELPDKLQSEIELERLRYRTAEREKKKA